MAKARGSVLPKDTLDLDDLRAPAGGARPQPYFHEQPTQNGDLKSRASATTLYLMPADHKRLRKIALEKGVSFQTMMLDAIDMLLAKEGEPPVERWDTRRKAR